MLRCLVLQFPRSPLCFLGDFNMPKINWSGSVPVVSETLPGVSSFAILCLDFTQMVSQPTRIGPTSANILDLILTAAPGLVHSISYVPGTGDHSLIHFVITTCNTRQPLITKTFRNYKNGDYVSINKELELFLEGCTPTFFDRTVEENWVFFKNSYKSH